MASTKIINVLKDDSFSEILSIFKSAAADEVILVLPKRSKAFQKEEHFETLKTEAGNLGKSVSFLCSNPDLNAMAKQYGFDVLLARQPVSRPKRSAPSERKASGSVNLVNELEDFYEHQPVALAEEEIAVPEETVPPEESEAAEEEAEPAIRRMSDVVRPAVEDERNIKVKAARERQESVDISHGFSVDTLEHRALNEIKSASYRPNLAPPMPAQRVHWRSWIKSKPKQPGQSSGSRYKKTLIGGGAVVAVFLGVFVFAWAGSAQVTIVPKSTPLDFKLTMAASSTLAAPDAANMKIPGQLFNIQKNVSNDFQTTGHVDVAQKARGTITVFNQTATSQQLIATTRFQSADNHIFRTVVSVIVPAAKGSNPGTATVGIVADKAGADYNVAAGKFTIPAFSEKGDTAKFQNIYGQSDAPMHGGTSGQSSVVAQSDYDQAKTALTQQLQLSIQTDLQSQINGLKVINDAQFTAANPTTTAGVGDSASSFTMNIDGSLKTVGFRESDVTDIIKQYVQTKYNLTAVPDKLTLNYGDAQFDSATNTLQFSVTVTGPGYASIDQQSLLANLMGKDEIQIKAYLQGVSAISSAQVLLSPFWVRSVPNNPAKVHVNTQY